MIRPLLVAVAGASIPLGLLAVYLWAVGALGAFVSIATNYWPLYASLDGDHRSRVGLSRLAYIALSYRDLGGLSPWLAPAALGAYIALYQSKLDTGQKRQVWLMLGLLGTFSLYTALAGQFWRYHWLPFYFFSVQLAALCVVDQPKGVPTARLIFPPALLAVTILTTFPIRVTADALRWRPLRPSPAMERAAEISRFLDAHLRPGDTVQPLDWTGGATHAMLISKAPLATSFVYDFHFYHDISKPYIRELRRRFVGELTRAQPRFVVEITAEEKPWPSGDDTTREFKELRELLTIHYRVAAEGDGYRIHEIAAVPPGRAE